MRGRAKRRGGAERRRRGAPGGKGAVGRVIVVAVGHRGYAAPTRAAAAFGSPSIGSTRSWLTPRIS
jgi:hypothetical protein